MATQSKSPNRVVVPHSAKWHGRLAARCISTTVRCLASTIRFQVDDRIGLAKSAFPENAIFVAWHNRLALSIPVYDRFISKRKTRFQLAALVSASKDGALLARVLENLHVQPIRGSTSRRGPQALLELTKWVERGYDLAITPDGPRGPAYKVQNGVIALAQLTGRPIIPVSINLQKKKTFQTWDRFQVPYPFSRAEVVFAHPINVPREASESDRDDLCTEVQNGLLAITSD